MTSGAASPRVRPRSARAWRWIGKLLGHAQVQTTARYAHLAGDTVKASAPPIGGSIAGDLEAR